MSMSLSLDDLIVLVVEPSSIQARIVGAALGRLGVEHVRTVSSGAEALASMRQARPALVMSALYLPDMSGTDVVYAMRRNPDLEAVGFILISSETRPQVLDPVRQAGVCGILPKPFSDTQLATALRSTLDFLNTDDSLSHAAPDLEMLKVLIVDDSSSARKFIRRVLSNLGVEHFHEAGNGREAVAWLEDNYVDLVVTDYNMPEMDGQQLVSHIRSRSWQSSVPVLMVTSEQDAGRLAAVEEAGVSGVCDKPFEPAVVRQLLQRILPVT